MRDILSLSSLAGLIGESRAVDSPIKPANDEEECRHA
jgi:hypothetical protein